MTDTLALEYLFNGVTARFEADKTLVPNLFGWREKTKHVVNGAANGAGAGNRIIWLPGNEPGNGDVGKLVAPSKMTVDPNGNPRSLATLLEVFTVYIQGSDPAQPSNEMAQYKMTRLLFDAWLRAVYLQAYGTFDFVSVNWDRTKTERQHGAMLIAVCTLQAMIPDAAYAVAPVDTHAILATHVLSQTDPAVEVDPKT